MSTKPVVYSIEVVAEPGVDPIEALRHAKRWLPRRCRLEVVRVVELPAAPST